MKTMKAWNEMENGSNFQGDNEILEESCTFRLQNSLDLRKEEKSRQAWTKSRYYAMIVNNLRTYSEGDLLQGNCSLSRNRQELWGITDQNYGEITMSIYWTIDTPFQLIKLIKAQLRCRSELSRITRDINTRRIFNSFVDCKTLDLNTFSVFVRSMYDFYSVLIVLNNLQ